MIVVLTGGGGFIGRNLARRLRRDGHEVRCLVRPSGADVPAGVKRYVVQYGDPRSLLECEALTDAQVVFHLAGATHGVRPEAFMTANVTPTRHLLGAITARRLVPRFVYVSSQAAAGPAPSRERPVDEDDPPMPVESYGRSKLEAERVVRTFSDRVPVTIVRPCAVFGPYDRGFLPLFRLAERGVILYPGTATHWMSVLHVDDVIDGLLALARSDRTISQRYFLTSPEPVQWRALGEQIADAVGVRARHVNVLPSLVRTASLAGEWMGRLSGTVPAANRSRSELARQRFWVCSGAKAAADAGFTAARSLPDALRDTYYWYRERGWCAAHIGQRPRSPDHRDVSRTRH